MLEGDHATGTTKRRLLIRDDPLSDLRTEDRFRHVAYETALSELVDDANPPFTIGLFGGWGTGKTSIVEQLRPRYEHQRSKESAFVSIDVWKFQTDSFKRQFLIELERAFTSQSLKLQPSPTEELDRQRSEVVTSPIAIDWAQLSLSWMVVAIPTSVLLFLGYLLLSRSGTDNPLAAAITLIFVPTLVFLVQHGTNIVVRNTTGSLTLLPPVSADRFETLLKESVIATITAAKITKVVAVIDNLDRLQGAQVVEALGSLKTFLEVPGCPFVFVIPCDDEAIRVHLEQQYRTPGSPQGHAQAAEFLRKFFNVSIPVTPSHTEEVLSFTLEQVQQLELGLSAPEAPQVRRRIAEIVAHSFPESPRRVKQFLNNLAARERLASARRAEGIFVVQDVALNILLLLKLMVIEERWPNIYSEIKLTPARLLTYQTAASSPVPDTPALPPGELGFGDFLLATEDVAVRPSDVRAYIRLKQTVDEATLPHYQSFRTAAETHDVGNLHALIPQSADALQRHIFILANILHENLEHGELGQARNVLSSMLALAKKVDDDEVKIAFAHEFDRMCRENPELMNLVSQVDPHEVLNVFESRTTRFRSKRQVVDRLINSIHPKEGAPELPFVSSAQLARALVVHIELLTDAQQVALRAKAVQAMPNRELMWAFISAEQAEMLIDGTLVRSFLDSLTLEELQGATDERSIVLLGIKRLDRFVTIPEHADPLVGHIFNAISQGDGGPANRELLLRGLEMLPVTITSASDGAISNGLTHLRSVVERHAVQPIEALRGCLRIVHRLNDEELSWLRTFASETLLILDWPDACEVIEHRPRLASPLDLEFWFEIVGRKLDLIDNDDQAEMAVASLLGLNKMLSSTDLAVRTLSFRLDNPSHPKWEYMLKGVERVIARRDVLTRPKGDLPIVQALADSAIKSFEIAPERASARTLSPLVAMAEFSRDLDFMRAFDHLLQRRAPKSALQYLVQELESNGRLTDEQREQIMDAIETSLQVEAPATTQDFEEVVRTYELMRSLAGRSPEGLFEIVRSYSRPDGLRPIYVPEEYRLAAYRQLQTLAFLPRADATARLREILDEAKGTPDEAMRREILTLLAVLRRSKVESRSGIWREIANYVESLGSTFSDVLDAMVTAQ